MVKEHASSSNEDYSSSDNNAGKNDIEDKTPEHKRKGHLSLEGRILESYADGKVVVYSGHDPKTVIDIPEFGVKITAHWGDPLDHLTVNIITQITVRADHHKTETVFSFADHEHAEGHEREVWAPDGLVGFTVGRRLDLYIASRFYADQRMTDLTRDCDMDPHVKDVLDFAVISAGKLKHPKSS